VVLCRTVRADTWYVQIISRMSEAYGHMMLSTGLFHADAHPGNIMVMPRGVLALIDYGQSKQLTDEERWLFARLVVGLAECAHSLTE
jgi:predicted unusual protein kinase regulating ubiquinone biosynthesis (AarF/ABC1/UbiB family)